MTTDNTHDEEPQAWCPGCGDRIPTEVIRKRGVCSNCYGTTDDPWATDQALAEAWAEGHRTGWEHCQDGNYGNDYWDDPTPNPYAAARAVTTAEQPCRHCGSCDGPPSCPDCDHADRRTETTTDHPCGDYPAPCNCDDPDTHDGATTETTTATIEDAARVMRDEWMQHGPEVTWLHMARALDARGLLATARTVNVHPTYTVEYQQKIADELGVEREAVLRALGLAAPLLATARTRPTETTTEWGRRAEGYQDWIADPKYVDDPRTAAEESARLTGGTVIRREVTPWTEVDQ